MRPKRSKQSIAARNRSKASRLRQARSLSKFWKNLRVNDPVKFAQTCARIRATWAAKRAAKLPADEGRKAVDTNIKEGDQ
jgi:hypothetical protein